MKKKDFLFEIGLEEVPAGYIKNSMEQIENIFISELKERNLHYKNLRKFSSPRRFAFQIEQLDVKEQDEVIERVGPTVKIAYDDGKLTKAGAGFLRSCNCSENDIFFKKTKKGKKIAVNFTKKGKKVEAILPLILKKIFNELNFPKSMKWGAENTAFVRPIRWLIVLIGNQVVPFEVADIKSSNYTYGNRITGLANKIILNSPMDYEKRLLDNLVIVDRKKRKQNIIKQINQSKYNVIPNTNLLETVVDLVEYPNVVEAEFDKKYLQLPEKIIILTLSEHQKYFAMQNIDGEIINKFIFVANSKKEYSKQIKQGNEKVVKARLEDAEFYFKEDMKQELEAYVEKTKAVLFHQKLGSLFAKTQRIIKICKFMLTELDTKEEDFKKNTIRTAYLCKADLVTHMMGEKEFSKLQGYVGKEYAKISGEKEIVANAIYEHYLPKGQDSKLPQTRIGSIVAIADKMDTVCGIIGAGEKPTSSNDPYALRRAAYGIIRIIEKMNLSINLISFIEASINIIEVNTGMDIKNYTEIVQFFKDRVNWFLKQQAIDYDVIRSVMHIDYSDIADLKQRAQDLQRFKNNNEFVKLVIGYKRVANIIKDLEEINKVKENLLKQKHERILYEKYKVLNEEIKSLLYEKSYKKILQQLVKFRVYIDNFFDNVMVNTDDKKLRKNRYNLLGNIRKMFRYFADLEKLVVSGEE